MLTTRQEHLVSLLLASFPNFSSGDAEAALAAYAMVIGGKDERDVEAGIMALINGEVLGFDGRFAPTATQLARAIREALERRVDAENAERRRLPPPVEDREEPTPEQKARVKALMEHSAKTLGVDFEADEREAQRLARLRRTNEYFDRQAAAYETFNSADDDEHDMGQQGAA